MKRLCSRVKEPFCGLSHWTGAGLSVAGLILLLIVARGKPWHTVSFAIYGASLIFLYLASAIYHTLHVPDHIADRLQQLDHSAIFVLIAGTYTPVCLVALRGAWGWSILGTIYALAAFGIAVSLFWRRAPHWIRVTLCIVMGWLALIALGPLKAAFPPQALGWLVWGGIIYSVGTIFYATGWPTLWRGRFTGHDLWHVFVLGGSVCHYILMFCFVAHAA